MDAETDLFIEVQGGLVVGPDVQGYVVIPGGTGVVDHIGVKLLTDMQPAGGLVHAEIVDIERFDVRHAVIVEKLFVDAEGIAQHLAIMLRHKDRRMIVGQNGL